MTRIIPINTDKAIKKYLQLANAIQDQNKLKPVELDVLAKLCYINSLYSHLDKDNRNIILFHPTTKKKIRESVNNLSQASLNNILSSLRKKKLITSKELLLNIPIKDNQLVFNLTFNLNEGI